jgi:tRNA (Thr-GGU) A37 N-methylase
MTESSEFHLQAIGHVRAARTTPEDDCWGGERARIVLAGPYTAESLEGLSAFSHIEVVFVFHQVPESQICRVLKVEERALQVSELDAIDGTPVLDIKPVMAEFLPREPVRQPAWSRELMREYWLRKSAG